MLYTICLMQNFTMIERQTIWFQDQTQPLLEPNLDPIYLQRVILDEQFLEMEGKISSPAPELLEGTVIFIKSDIRILHVLPAD